MNWKVFLAMFMLYLSIILKGIQERLLILAAGVLLTIIVIGWEMEVRKKLRHIMISLITAHLIMLLLLSALRYRSMALEPDATIIKDTTAVVLLLEGEPEDFVLSLAINNAFNSIKSYQIPLLPFMIFKNKIVYENALSTDFQLHSLVQQKLQSQLGNSYRLYVTYTKKPPYLREGIYAALAEGNRKIIFAPVLIAENESFLAIEETLKRINTGKYQIITKRTEAMWNSDAIALLYVSKINQATTGRVQNTGIILLGSATSREPSVTALQQEVLLKEKIKSFLIEENYINYQIQETQFNKRNITKSIDALLEYGVSNILIVNTGALYETLEQQMELSRAIKSADAPDGVVITKLNVTAHDPEVIYELVNRINLLNMH